MSFLSDSSYVCNSPHNFNYILHKIVPAYFDPRFKHRCNISCRCQHIRLVCFLIYRLISWSAFPIQALALKTLNNPKLLALFCVSATANMSDFTPVEQFEEVYSTLFKTFRSGRTKSLSWRKWQLKQLWWMMDENEQRITNALRQDLNRHPFESYASDIYGIKIDILEHIKHVEEWASDEPLSAAGLIMGKIGKARIRKEPLGVALVIGAWNFPFLLLIQPVIAAITAGCCVLMKPSELAPASQKLLQDLVAQYLDPDAIALVTGGQSETSHYLKRKFDHIFFTGSSKVARHIASAAAKHLTPIVLELGGQGPAIVTQSADVDLAAKRIAYAKFLNAGQGRCNDTYYKESNQTDRYNSLSLSQSRLCPSIRS